MADNQEYTFFLNPAGNLVLITSDGKTEEGSIRDIKRGNLVKITGWSGFVE